MNIRTSALLGIMAATLALAGCARQAQELGGTSSASESSSPQASESSPVPSESPAASPSSTTESPEGDGSLAKQFMEHAQAGGKAPREMVEELKQALEGADQPTADDLIRAMERYDKKQLPAFEKKFDDTAIQQALSKLQYPITEAEVASLKDKNARNLAQDAIDGGYKLEMAEGYVFPVIDYARLLAYKDKLSDAMNAYLGILAAESTEASAKDAGLVISWQELQYRTLAAENYVQTYPATPERAEIEKRFLNYLYIYFYGLNNTPIFDFDTYHVQPEVKALYESAAEKHKDMVTGRLSKEMLDVLTKTKGAVFAKAKDGSQTDIHEMKAFRDSIEAKAKDGLPKN